MENFQFFFFVKLTMVKEGDRNADGVKAETLQKNTFFSYKKKKLREHIFIIQS